MVGCAVISVIFLHTRPEGDEKVSHGDSPCKGPGAGLPDMLEKQPGRLCGWSRVSEGGGGVGGGGVVRARR